MNEIYQRGYQYGVAHRPTPVANRDPEPPPRERSHSNYEPSDADSSGTELIVKLVVGLLIIAAIIWFVFAVAIPLLVIDIASIALIVGLTRRNLSRFLMPISVAGAALVVADYNRGWFTKALANNLPFLAGIVPILLYINVLAGLVSAYFLIRMSMDKRKPPLPNVGEFTKRNLIAMACMLFVGLVTVALQVRIDKDRRPVWQPVDRSALGVTTIGNAPAPETNVARDRPKPPTRLNAEGLRALSAIPPNYTQAKGFFEQAVQLDPNNVETLNNLGYVYDKLGDYRSAEQALTRVIGLAPGRIVAYGNLGDVEAKLGNTQEAASRFCQYVHLFKSAQHGKEVLVRTFTDSNSNVQLAVRSTIANCN